MRDFILIALLTTTVITVVYGRLKIQKCKSKHGICVPENERKGRCKRLPYRCSSGLVCCKKKRSSPKKDKHVDGTGSNHIIESTLRRRCSRTRRKCLKNNGICIPMGSNTCTTGRDDSLCKGASCTCCLNSIKNPCQKSSECKKNGGFCMKRKRSTCKGTLDKRLCKGKKCSCCIRSKVPDSSPSSCQCGQANEARVVGGNFVSPQNKYPWLVGLYNPSLIDAYFCGGSIINDKYIITAAHCAFNVETGKQFKAEDIKIGVGDHNQASSADNVDGVTRKIGVEDVIIHENYEINNLNNNDDIALMKLTESLDLSSHTQIRPVCLPADDSKTYEGENGVVAGWGLTDYETGDISDILLETVLPILSPECKGKIPVGVTITTNMLCAGFKSGGKDACNGDSGGPLVVREDSRYVLVGIVSFGFGCAEPDIPGIYTRVTSYLDWIKENTNDGNSCS